MKVAFQPIEPRKIYMRVVDQVVNMVREGHLKPGDKLPPERVIAEQMGISRPTVREAFAALEVIGVVETRTGQGSFIRSVDLENLMSRAESLFLEERSPFEILETRKALESYGAALAAERATSEQLAEIERALQMLRDGVAENQEWSEVADRQFHAAMAKASGNSVLADVLNVLLDMSEQRLWAKLREVDYSVPGNLEKGLGEHRRIYQAIWDRDAEAARDAVLKHFADVERDVFDAY